MYLEIITPAKTVFASEVDRVRLPGVKGPFEILKNHAPIISSLEEGLVRIIKDKDLVLQYKISGGVAECKSNHIIVLSESAEPVV